MQSIIPHKLKRGDIIRVIAPSTSHKIHSKFPDYLKLASKRLEDLGLIVTYGKHVNEIDEFDSFSIESRVADLMDAFEDKTVKMVFPSEGGFNSNQLLKYIDWDIIRKNPKIFCGYSDITTLNTAIYTKTGLVTYCGPNFSSFGEKLGFDYTLDYFTKCLMSDKPFNVVPSKEWSDDEWWKHQDKRKFLSNEGYLPIQEGEAEGALIGGNMIILALQK